MRTPLLLLLFAPFLFTACTGGDATVTEQPGAPVEAAPAVPDAINTPDTALVHLHSLAGSGLKFNGVYDMPSGNVHYIMRFFERGNVVLVAGRQEPDDPNDLRLMLTENAQSGTSNIHNVPVTLRGDSLFFSTMATRGAITYAGVVDGDTLRFNKASKATGKRGEVHYGFVPDGASLH